MLHGISLVSNALCHRIVSSIANVPARARASQWLSFHLLFGPLVAFTVSSALAAHLAARAVFRCVNGLYLTTAIASYALSLALHADRETDRGADVEKFPCAGVVGYVVTFGFVTGASVLGMETIAPLLARYLCGLPLERLWLVLMPMMSSMILASAGGLYRSRPPHGISVGASVVALIGAGGTRNGAHMSVPRFVLSNVALVVSAVLMMEHLTLTVSARAGRCVPLYHCAMQLGRAAAPFAASLFLDGTPCGAGAYWSVQVSTVAVAACIFAALRETDTATVRDPVVILV